MPSELLQRGKLAKVLAGLNDAAWLEALSASQAVTLPQGEVVFRDGDICRNYLLVAEGSIKVQKISASGREIMLYRVGPGESCVLTTSCLLTNERYPAEGITDTVVSALAIPSAQFRACLMKSEDFRDRVFNLYGRRIRDLLMLVEDIAFGRLDARLAHYLLAHAVDSTILVCTHQEIAAELGTAREVVSRHLKLLDKSGLVRVRRGSVELLKPAMLRDLAARMHE